MVIPRLLKFSFYYSFSSLELHDFLKSPFNIYPFNNGLDLWVDHFPPQNFGHNFKNKSISLKKLRTIVCYYKYLDKYIKHPKHSILGFAYLVNDPLEFDTDNCIIIANNMQVSRSTSLSITYS